MRQPDACLEPLAAERHHESGVCLDTGTHRKLRKTRSRQGGTGELHPPSPPCFVSLPCFYRAYVRIDRARRASRMTGVWAEEKEKRGRGGRGAGKGGRKTGGGKGGIPLLAVSPVL